jgi:nucleotide-binding universal stress UspA family protein
MKLEKILIPLDGSALAESAISKAMELAGGESTLMLLRAAEAHSLPGVDPTEAQVEVVREAEEYLASVAARLKEQGIDRVETSVWYRPDRDEHARAQRSRAAHPGQRGGVRLAGDHHTHLAAAGSRRARGSAVGGRSGPADQGVRAVVNAESSV